MRWRDGEMVSEWRKNVNADHMVDFVHLPGNFQEPHLEKGHWHGLHAGPRDGSAAAQRVHGCSCHTGFGEHREDEDNGDVDGPTAGGSDGQDLPGNPPFISRATLILDWLLASRALMLAFFAPGSQRPAPQRQRTGRIRLRSDLFGGLQQPDFGQLRWSLADQGRNLLTGGIPGSLEAGQLPWAAAQCAADEKNLQSHRVPPGSDESEGVPQVAT